MSLSYLEAVFHVSPVTLITTVVAVLLGVLYLILKDKDLPPGPVGLPFLGYWPFLNYESVHLQLHELTKKYGDVFSMRIAGKLFIHLGSIKAVKEANISKSDFIDKKSADYNVMPICFGKGIITRNGEEWKVIRKFFSQAFKEFGLTSMKDYMAGSIYDSVNATIETLKKSDGSSVDIIPIINLSSLSIFRRMVFNDNEVTEKEIQDILDAFVKLFVLFEGKSLFLYGDFAKKFLFPRTKNFKEVLKSVTLMEKYLMKIIRRHEETFDKNNIRDLIDSFIKERKDRISKNDPTAKYFSDEALVGSLIEFVGDGIFTVSLFITHFINTVVKYPEEQEKIYRELIDVVGSDRGVTLENKNKLPYTNAFLQEATRMTDMFTYLPGYECTKETTLSGYKIPVGAVTMVNFWSSHHDPKVFDEPFTFKTSRYINEKGKPKAESPISFGIGKRACIGEQYTMMQVFLFLTTIVKNFKLVRPEGDEMTSLWDGHMDVCVYQRK